MLYVLVSLAFSGGNLTENQFVHWQFQFQRNLIVRLHALIHRRMVNFGFIICVKLDAADFNAVIYGLILLRESNFTSR